MTAVLLYRLMCDLVGMFFESLVVVVDVAMYDQMYCMHES
jgi:hypothetical protein